MQARHLFFPQSPVGSLLVRREVIRSQTWGHIKCCCTSYYGPRCPAMGCPCAGMTTSDLWAFADPLQEESSYFRTLTETMQLQSVLDYLNESREILPATTSLQAHGIVSLYYFTKGDLYKGREYLLKSAHLLMRYDLHLVRSSRSPNNDTITVPSTEDEIGAILQVYYMDKAAHVQFHVPCLFHPDLDSELYLLSVSMRNHYDLSLVSTYTRNSMLPCQLTSLQSVQRRLLQRISRKSNN